MPADACALVLTGLFAAGLGQAADPPPDTAMLEFLGGFETADGHWVDPMCLDARIAEPAKATAPQQQPPAPKAPPEEKRHD
jgi:hypothetical protein